MATIIQIVRTDGTRLELPDAVSAEVWSDELVFSDSEGRVVAIFAKDTVAAYGCNRASTF